MKAAINALSKFVTKTFTEEQVDEIGFFPDTETPQSYTWNIELNKKRYSLTYTYSDKQVAMTQVN